MTVAARGRRDDERGAILAFVAIGMVMLLAATALSIDLGAQMLRRREAQAAADVAALDLAHLLDGRSAAAILVDPTWASTLLDSAARNRFPATGLVAELGTYDRETDTFTPVTGPTVPDAVRVRAADTVRYAFARVLGILEGSVSRAAVASRGAIAGFSIGSFGLALDSSTSPLLDALLDDALDVQAVGYDGLAHLDVGLDALAAELQLGTVDELLTTDVALRTLLLASANVLEDDGHTAEATFVRSIATATALNTPVTVGDLVHVGAGDGAGAIATLDALDLVAGSVLLANGTHALTTSALDLGVPGLGSLQPSVSVIEVPQSAFGPLGTSAHTAQVSVSATASGAIGLGFLLPTVQVQATLHATVADATGTISAIDCATPGGLEVTVADALTTLSLQLQLTILGVTTTLTVQSTPASNPDTAAWTFPPDLLEPPTRRETGTGTIALSGLSVSGTTALGALLDPVLTKVVTPIVQGLDAKLLGPLVTLLGVNVSGADVWPRALACAPPTLVQ